MSVINYVLSFCNKVVVYTEVLMKRSKVDIVSVTWRYSQNKAAMIGLIYVCPSLCNVVTSLVRKDLSEQLLCSFHVAGEPQLDVILTWLL